MSSCVKFEHIRSLRFCKIVDIASYFRQISDKYLIRVIHFELFWVWVAISAPTFDRPFDLIFRNLSFSVIFLLWKRLRFLWNVSEQLSKPIIFRNRIHRPTNQSTYHWNLCAGANFLYIVFSTYTQKYIKMLIINVMVICRIIINTLHLEILVELCLIGKLRRNMDSDLPQ